MNRTTPPKHKTPNYKLVTLKAPDLPPPTEGFSIVVWVYPHWYPVPLRADRKDIP